VVCTIKLIKGTVKLQQPRPILPDAAVGQDRQVVIERVSRPCAGTLVEIVVVGRHGLL
jgi:hypothetical protein